MDNDPDITVLVSLQSPKSEKSMFDDWNKNLIY